MVERSLPGGFVNEVVRVGDTVRRPRSGEFVHRVLEHLDGWPGAPRLLGVDSRGREVLEFLDGHVAWEARQPAAVSSDESLVRVARLVREFHDLTVALAGDQEVLCHNDLSPKNTVYRDLGGGLRPVAFIDWDHVAPGRRVHDVAHVCWQYLALGPGADVDAAARGVRLISEAYGLADRNALVDTILWWQDRCWRGIVADTRPAGERLRAAGVVEEVRAQYEWVTEHRGPLDPGRS
ncbi:phosphotransferase [Umezawaea endophytica]|uniref:Phosphotransferase n=1 Tax=Umezawaea endophytica TaxID=1654476 RepID=A0A9X2ZZU8_9PSEU|nr:phosphotransferase [Umezawaea endophytica]MCS7476278.1 phosphotransferase [Umezawaea endophytica]